MAELRRRRGSLWARGLGLAHESGIGQRLARGLGWSLAGAVVSRGAGVLGTIATARLLGIVPFGEFTTVQSTVGLFGAFAGLGLGVTGTKYAAELRDADPRRCGRVLGLLILVAAAGGLAAGAALFLMAPWVAERALAAPQLTPALRCASGVVVTGALQGVYAGALAGLEAFRSAAWASSLAALAGMPFLVAGAALGDLPGAALGIALQGAVGVVVGHRVLAAQARRHGIGITPAGVLEERRVLWSFTLPAFLSSLVASPANWACNTLLVKQPGGFEEAALLNAAGQWKNLLGFLPATLTSVLLPVLSTLGREDSRRDFNRLLRRSLFLASGACLIAAVPFCLGATTILGWYGDAFRRGTPVLVLSLAGTALVAANNLLSRAMQARGSAWLEMSFSVLWGGVLVGSCLQLVPGRKATGVAIAHLIAAVVLGMWQAFALRRTVSRPPSLTTPPR